MTCGIAVQRQCAAVQGRWHGYDSNCTKESRDILKNFKLLNNHTMDKDVMVESNRLLKGQNENIRLKSIWQIHQQNVCWSWGAYSSMWEEVDCKLTSVNFKCEWENRRGVWPAVGLRWILDDRYISTMVVIVISVGAFWSTVENIVCIWVCFPRSGGIPYKLQVMLAFCWILLNMTARTILNSARICGSIL
jgi:hypothetical protein